MIQIAKTLFSSAFSQELAKALGSSRFHSQTAKKNSWFGRHLTDSWGESRFVSVFRNQVSSNQVFLGASFNKRCVVFAPYAHTEQPPFRTTYLEETLGLTYPSVRNSLLLVGPHTRLLMNNSIGRSFSTQSNGAPSSLLANLSSKTKALSGAAFFYMKKFSVLTGLLGTGFGSGWWWTVNSGNTQEGKKYFKVAQELEKKNEWHDAIHGYENSIEKGLGLRLKYQATLNLVKCFSKVSRVEYLHNENLSELAVTVHEELVNSPFHPHASRAAFLLYSHMYYIHASNPDFLRDAERVTKFSYNENHLDREFKTLFDDINKRNNKIKRMHREGHGISPSSCGIVSPAEFASLSAEVYRNGSFISETDRWERIYQSNPDPSVAGYYGEIYINYQKKHIAVVHRGTVSHQMASWATNLKFFFKTTDDQFEQAKKTTKAAEEKRREQKEGYQITQTGHSQGAYLAEYEAFRTDEHAVTFDSPGSRDLILDKFNVGHDNGLSKDEAYGRFSKITEFLAEPNPVNCLQPHSGNSLYHLIIPQQPDPGTPPSIFESIKLYLLKKGILSLGGDLLIDATADFDLIRERIPFHSIGRMARYLKQDGFNDKRVEFHELRAWPRNFGDLHTLCIEQKKDKPSEELIGVIYKPKRIDRHVLTMERVSPDIAESLYLFYDNYHKPPSSDGAKVLGLEKKVLEHCYLNGYRYLVVLGGWTADELEQYISRHAKLLE